MRNLVFAAGAALFLVTGGAFAQTAKAPKTFEVASVKPAEPIDMQKMVLAMQNGEPMKIGMHVYAGRVEFKYLDLKSLIYIAYKVKPYQITAPDWAASQRFDITAKFPPGATRDDVPEMLKALLKDRLKVEAHVESKEHPVLALVVGKSGPKLKESAEAPAAIDENAPLAPGETSTDGPDGQVRMKIDMKGGGATVNMGAKGKMSYHMDQSTMTLKIDAQQISMDGFVDMLSQFTQMTGTGGKVVVDMTNLKGHYDITFDLSLAELMAIAKAAGMDTGGVPAGGAAPAGAGAGPAASDPTGAGSVLSSVQALGLKLENRKAVIDQLIVDHAEKAPVEN